MLFLGHVALMRAFSKRVERSYSSSALFFKKLYGHKSLPMFTFKMFSLTKTPLCFVEVERELVN